MSIREKPHYEIPAAELAAWVERHGEQWWSLDGEVKTLGKLDVPCAGSDLARVFRRRGKPLLVLDEREQPQGNGEVVGADMLDALSVPWVGDEARRRAEPPIWANDKMLTMSWIDEDREWRLIEDSEAAADERRYQAEAAAANGRK